MSYIKSSPILITEEALVDIRRQYKLARMEADAAVREMERLVKINTERDKLFEVMKEQFDLLFDEVENLRENLNQRELQIKSLQIEVKSLKKRRKPKKPIDWEREV